MDIIIIIVLKKIKTLYFFMKFCLILGEIEEIYLSSLEWIFEIECNLSFKIDTTSHVQLNTTKQNSK